MLGINLINLAFAFLLFILALLFLLFYNHITLSAAIFILVAITPFLLLCYGMYKMINKEIKKAITNLNTIAQTYEFENKKAYSKNIKFADGSEYRAKFAKTFRAYTIDIYKVC